MLAHTCETKTYTAKSAIIRTCAVVTLAMLVAIVLSAQQPSRTDQEHTAWIDQVMRDIATIKPGMTRADLLRMFREEGGFSTIQQRTYVYAHCPYIKVTFTFAPVNKPDAKGRITNESPDDKILKMSEPFLGYSVLD